MTSIRPLLFNNVLSGFSNNSFHISVPLISQVKYGKIFLQARELKKLLINIYLFLSSNGYEKNQTYFKEKLTKNFDKVGSSQVDEIYLYLLNHHWVILNPISGYHFQLDNRAVILYTFHVVD